MLLVFIGLISCSSSEDSGDEMCPQVGEDSCMTEELFEQCLAEAEMCDGELVMLESCPYAGFECLD